MAHLPLDERVVALADPARRRRILAEHSPAGLGAFVARMGEKLFPLADPPNYEPARRDSLGLAAAREGRQLDEVSYDVYLRAGGRQLVLFTLNGYAAFNADHIKTMIEDPHTMLGLADGGAHCSLICDASVYTSMLAFWVRDRASGTVPLELAVAKMTSIPAALYGFADRGVLAAGRRAGINVIDLPRLRLHPPEVAHDLPSGAPRVVQRANGYVRTYVAGAPVTVDDADSGARPGRLVRRH